jgi:predicted site-specific integrase-resolvase
MHELKRFVKADKVAEMFDVKINTVWRWVSDGKLRSTKLAGATRFDPDDIQEFILKGQNRDVTT